MSRRCLIGSQTAAPDQRAPSCVVASQVQFWASKSRGSWPGGITRCVVCRLVSGQIFAVKLKVMYMVFILSEDTISPHLPALSPTNYINGAPCWPVGERVEHETVWRPLLFLFYRFTSVMWPFGLIFMLYWKLYSMCICMYVYACIPVYVCLYIHMFLWTISLLTPIVIF